MWFFMELQAWMSRMENIVSANQDKLNALADQLDKAKAEIVAAVQALKDQLAAGETLDFSRLESAAQSLDDLNPDAPPAPEPVEPPVEPPAI